MQEHATGIEFREWNAGSMIDAHMRDEGFNVKIRLDPQTGLIYGGNRWNCGTWMDKMGSSWKAKNAGVPATPRDGAAIEINALLYSTLNFLVNMKENMVFPYNGVVLRDGSRFEYATWREVLKSNFDKLFFIPYNADRISGYYKDTIGCSIPSNDLQLRPNQCIALAVAPDLFDRDHAVSALEVVRKELMPGLGTMQIGIMTLNSSDSSYRNFYENSNDSEDYNIAHGFSYHNGPEWVWPVGYFLQSVLIFTDDKKLVYKCLSQHLKTFENSPWMSLPELTNGYGKECPFSCMAQAWSIGPFIEVLQQIN
jgi:glycogen debranching enzyme